MKGIAAWVQRGIFLIVPVTGVTAWAEDKAGTTAVPFLTMGVGARALGMGEAATTVSTDATALYWNPGSMVRLENQSVTFMHAATVEETSSDYVAYARGQGSSAWGDVPNGRWAAVAAYGGAGIRYTTTRLINFEGRVLFGDGMAVSARGAFQWNKEGWKIRPLGGLEMSFLRPRNGKGESGESLLVFVGGEMRLAKRLTFQVDIGPALLRIHDKDSKKDEYEYENILNVSLNYYFGKSVL